VFFWLWTLFVEIWKVFYEASLFILFGFVVAGALQHWISAKQVYRLLGRKKFSSILLASIAGIPLPLCSCSVIPAAMALRRRGASRGATVSFLISTPETSAESITLTYALMDLPMTIFRPVAALITALFAGLATEVFGPANDEPKPETGTDIISPEPDDACCQDSSQPPEPERPSYRVAFIELFDDLAYWILLGLVLAGLISALAPSDLVGKYLGSGLLPMLAMLVISVPLYVCASGSTPIAAALIMKGLSPGAALVLLLAGPATNIATMTIVWKFLGKRVLIIYVASIVVVSLLLGIYVDGYYQSRGIDPQMSVRQTTTWLPAWLKVVAALGFIGLLANSLRRTPVPKEILTVGRWTRQALAFFRITPRGALGLLVLFLIVSYFLTCFLVVRPGECGIVKQFGRIVRWENLGPGLHVHWPYPFETGEICDKQSIRSLQLGFTQQITVKGETVYPPIRHKRYLKSPARTRLSTWDKVERESYYLTGDENEIDIQTIVQYRVADPVRFLYGLENPETIVRNHTISILIDLVGSNKIDEVYTFLRRDLESEVFQRLEAMLRQQDTGIELVGVFLASVHAPPEVHFEFRDLASAREDKARFIHDADGVAAEQVYGASGEASQKINAAQSDFVDRVARTDGDTDAYRRLVMEYERDRQAMETRLVYETYDQVLPRARLYLGVSGAQLGFWRWESKATLSGEQQVEPAAPPGPTLEDILGPR